MDNQPNQEPWLESAVKELDTSISNTNRVSRDEFSEFMPLFDPAARHGWSDGQLEDLSLKYRQRFNRFGPVFVYDGDPAKPTSKLIATAPAIFIQPRTLNDLGSSATKVFDSFCAIMAGPSDPVLGRREAAALRVIDPLKSLVTEDVVDEQLKRHTGGVKTTAGPVDAASILDLM